MPLAARLSPDQAVALTRQVLSYCLGRGSISFYSRSWSFSITHPRPQLELARYRHARLQRFLSAIKPPKWLKTPGSEDEDRGGWVLRTSSQVFETAYNLLYPGGVYEIRSTVLELLGVEALASLWADRGVVRMNKRQPYCTGRLGLQRHTMESAQLVHDWIFTLTGAMGEIRSSRYDLTIPMIRYDDLNTNKLMEAMADTWMAKAECLWPRFRTPNLLMQGRIQHLATEELRLRERRHQRHLPAASRVQKLRHALGPAAAGIDAEELELPPLLPVLRPLPGDWVEPLRPPVLALEPLEPLVLAV